MKLIRRLQSKSSILHLTAYQNNYTFIFERLKNSEVGHPRFKVFVIKNNYDYCYEYIVSQVYESLQDVALLLIQNNFKQLAEQ